MDPISEKVLSNSKPGDKFEVERLITGEFKVIQITVPSKHEIISREFDHLRNHSISLSDASQKYKVSHQNLSRWVKAGYITILNKDGYRLLIDEAEAAYCAKIYHEKHQKHDGNLKGVIIFDDQGNPYQMKYPDLAERKRIHRRKMKLY